MMLRAAILAAVLAGGAAAQTTQDVANAVQGWLSTHQAKGVVAVQTPDDRVTVHTLGLPSGKPIELASLSKAITAVCAATLVNDRQLRWTDPVSNHVPGFDSMTVGDLVTHQSGVTEDATQRYMSVWLHDPRHRATEIVTQMRTRGAPRGPSGTYAYSNDNYALLALVIEDVTGQPYETACHARALAPAGVVARPSPVSGAFLSWGGWAMTVEEYLRFHAHWFDTASAARVPPFADLGGGAAYGLGMLNRQMGGGSNHWHFGALCFVNDLNIGSFVVAFHNGWRAVVAYDTCVDWPAMVALDNTIVNAIFVPR